MHLEGFSSIHDANFGSSYSSLCSEFVASPQPFIGSTDEHQIYNNFPSSECIAKYHLKHHQLPPYQSFYNEQECYIDPCVDFNVDQSSTQFGSTQEFHSCRSFHENDSSIENHQTTNVYVGGGNGLQYATSFEVAVEDQTQEWEPSTFTFSNQLNYPNVNTCYVEPSDIDIYNGNYDDAESRFTSSLLSVSKPTSHPVLSKLSFTEEDVLNADSISNEVNYSNEQELVITTNRTDLVSSSNLWNENRYQEVKTIQSPASSISTLAVGLEVSSVDDTGNYPCLWDSCGKEFEFQKQLVDHVNVIHMNEKKRSSEENPCFWLYCSRREKPFNAKYKLAQHMRVHTKEKPYKCEYEKCCRAFARLENKKIHVRSHTGHKPFCCKFAIRSNCPKRFSNSSDRAKHEQTHINPKPYRCEVDGCPKRYTDPSSLRKHVKGHSVLEQIQYRKRRDLANTNKQISYPSRQRFTTLPNKSDCLSHNSSINCQNDSSEISGVHHIPMEIVKHNQVENESAFIYENGLLDAKETDKKTIKIEVPISEDLAISNGSTVVNSLTTSKYSETDSFNEYFEMFSTDQEAAESLAQQDRSTLAVYDEAQSLYDTVWFQHGIC